ncbi:protein kinase domain-containing protein [Streptosporangium longisporum]|uniref:serine/threonine protein kinase n=1 Tax=Streptosporangium longisporum TaxID=46187 RepID=UPI0039A74E2A
MADLASLRPGDPEQVREYRLTARLGEGGQGTVFLGESPAGVRVAVKLLRADLAQDEEAMERFVREVSTTRRVAPFCTAAVIDTGVEAHRPYIVSEYVDGPTLDAVVDGEGPREGAALHRLAIGTVTALVAIHQAGIVHRDFKPSNVLLAQDGPRVIDFGIAKALDRTSTLTAMAIGTPSYMTPEQLAGENAGSPADMFAWGCTMVFAATGQPPFGTDSLPAIFNRIMNMEPDLSAIADPALRDLVGQCLSKDADRRPTAGEALLRLLGHAGGPAGAVAPTAPRGILAEGSAAAAQQTGPGSGPDRHPAGDGSGPGWTRSTGDDHVRQDQRAHQSGHQDRWAQQGGHQDRQALAWQSGPGGGLPVQDPRGSDPRGLPGHSGPVGYPQPGPPQNSDPRGRPGWPGPQAHDRQPGLAYDPGPQRGPGLPHDPGPHGHPGVSGPQAYAQRPGPPQVSDPRGYPGGPGPAGYPQNSNPHGSAGYAQNSNPRGSAGPPQNSNPHGSIGYPQNPDPRGPSWQQGHPGPGGYPGQGGHPPDPRQPHRAYRDDPGAPSHPAYPGQGAPGRRKVGFVIGGALLATALVAGGVVLATLPDTGTGGTGTVRTGGTPGASTAASTPAPSRSELPRATSTIKLPGSALTLHESDQDPIRLSSYSLEWDKNLYVRQAGNGRFVKNDTYFQYTVNATGTQALGTDRMYDAQSYSIVSVVNHRTGAASRIRITKAPVYPTLPQWSPDGRRGLVTLYEAVGDTSKAYGFAIIDVSARKARIVRVREKDAGRWSYFWRGDGRAVGTWALDGKTQRIRFYDLKGTVLQTLLDVGAPITVEGDDTSPSGSSLMTYCKGTKKEICVWSTTADGPPKVRIPFPTERLIGWYDDEHIAGWRRKGSGYEAVVFDFTGQVRRVLVTSTDAKEYEKQFMRFTRED